MKLLLTGVLVLSLGGCATVTRGRNEDVKIEVEPKNAIVTTTLGHRCETSPCEVEVKRKKSFSVTAKAEGYVEQTVNVESKVAGKGIAASAGNILVGGIVGVAVDGISGATLQHVPNPVIIKLVPVGGPETGAPAATDASKARNTPTS